MIGCRSPVVSNRASAYNDKMTSTSLNLQASVGKSLFLGTLIESNILPFPAISTAERETLTLVLESVDKFMAGGEERYRTFDRNGAQPDE